MSTTAFLVVVQLVCQDRSVTRCTGRIATSEDQDFHIQGLGRCSTLARLLGFLYHTPGWHGTLGRALWGKNSACDLQCR